MRPKLTYANVMSTLCFFLLLGGGAYAATQLPKNSVGTKQLKKNSVTTAKIKAGAVSSAKIGGTLSGTQINSSTLGTVPNAQNAQTAQTATTVAPSENWHEIDQPGQPAFMNNWSDYESGSATAAFYRDAEGVVHFKGTLSGSIDATTAFILPPGFRPSEYRGFPTTGPNANSQIEVRPSGEVRPFCGQAGCAPSLDGITFRAES